MKSQFLVGFGLAGIIAFATATPASAQIADLGKIIAKKDKDAADAVDKAGKTSSSKRKPATTTRRAAPPKPTDVTAVYLPDSEDPMSVVGITPETVSHFSAGLAAESHQRTTSKPRMSAERYDLIGADAAGMTGRQYEVLKQRAMPFCQAVAKGLDRPEDTRLAYMPTEAEALKPSCKSMLPLLNSVMADAQSNPAPSATAKKR